MNKRKDTSNVSMLLLGIGVIVVSLLVFIAGLDLVTIIVRLVMG